MSAPPSFLNFQQRLRDPSMAGLMAFKWQLLCELRVAVPGIIKSFDSTKQTATVQVAIAENMVNPRTLAAEPMSIPVLSDVPVIMFRAGNFVLTFPVAEGDECLLIFGDNDYGAWWQSGHADSGGKEIIQNQVDRRRHDLSDSFAIVGLWSQPNKVENYSTDSVQLRSLDGSKAVSVQDSQILVETTDSSDVRVSSGGKIFLASASGEIDISAPTVKITGDLQINGAEYDLHEHSGVQTGGGNTGPVA
jgi:Phage protein Gp138 N-terminal domain